MVAPRLKKKEREIRSWRTWIVILKNKGTEVNIALFFLTEIRTISDKNLLLLLLFELYQLECSPNYFINSFCQFKIRFREIMKGHDIYSYSFLPGQPMMLILVGRFSIGVSVQQNVGNKVFWRSRLSSEGAILQTWLIHSFLSRLH